MTRQSSDYALDHTKGTGEVAKDRLHEMADRRPISSKARPIARKTMAGRVSEQAREYSEKGEEIALTTFFTQL